MKYVVDTSALICLIQREKGWEQVEEIFKQGVYMSAINLAEYYTWCFRNKFDPEISKSIIDTLGIQFEDLSSEEAFEIGSISEITHKYGLSIADRACLILSKNLKLKVITADRIWENLKSDFDVELVR